MRDQVIGTVPYPDADCRRKLTATAVNNIVLYLYVRSMFQTLISSRFSEVDASSSKVVQIAM